MRATRGDTFWRRALCAAGAFVTTGAVLFLPASLPAAAAASRGAPTTSASSHYRATPSGASSPHFSSAVPRLPHGAVRVGPMDTSAPITLDISLVPAHHQQLSELVDQIYTQGSPQFHHFLGPGQFAQQFGSPSSALAAVTGQLAADGMSVGTASADGLFLPVSTTVGTAESVFGVSISQVRLADGKLTYANTTAPTIPASIRPYVAGVVGLDAAATQQPADAARFPSISSSPPCNLFSGYTTSSLAGHYGFSSADLTTGTGTEVGQGQTIALFELGAFTTSDIVQYGECYNGASPTITGVTPPVSGANPTVEVVSVDGGTNAVNFEVELDLEELMSLAPSATILVYEAPNVLTSTVDEYARIVNDDQAQVISTSWGACEPYSDQGTITAENLIFEQAAAQGQSVLAASGDAGSEACSQGSSGRNNTQLAVQDPASQPFVTGVGGTSYNASIIPATETAWNDSNGAGGGGISSVWPMSSWQQGFGVVNAYSSSTPCGAQAGTFCREVPDISADAENYGIYFQGQWTVAVGTSAAAPLWASFVLLQNQTCSDNTGTETASGFLNPRLYGLAESNPLDFNFITTGNNDLTGSNGGAYPADPGADLESSEGAGGAVEAESDYSMATGLGTPSGSMFTPWPATPAFTAGQGEGLFCNGTTLPPVVVSVSPDAGSPSGGPPMVTITGNNFTGVTNVNFGSQSASSFKVLSDTQIEAIAPAGAIPPGQSSATVDVTVTEGTLTSAVNRPYDDYTYTSGPVVNSVTAGNGSGSPGDPSCALLANGIAPAPYGPGIGAIDVTLCGTGFTNAASVQFFTGQISSTLNNANCTGSPPPSPTAQPSCYLTATLVPNSVNNSGTQMTVVAPPDPNVSSTRSCDTTDVVVTTSAGSSFVNPGISTVVNCPPSSTSYAGSGSTGDQYSFTNQPVVTGISTTLAPMQGLVPMTISGYNFTRQTGFPATAPCSGNPDMVGVGFGNSQVLGLNCRVVSDTQITVEAPPVQFPGTVDARVEMASATGISFSPAVAADNFSFVACSASYQTNDVIALSPSSGSGYVIGDGSGRAAACGSAPYVGAPSDPFGFNTVTNAPQVVPAFGGCPAPPLPAGYPSRQNDWTVAMTSAPGIGYWESTAEGTVFNFLAGFFGDTYQLNPALPPGGTNSVALSCPIVGMASTADGGGYWLVASDGGIFTFGDAKFYGSTGSLKLNSPIVGMATTPDGEGYWLVASDGGVFTFGPTGGAYGFGDATFYGSMGGKALAQPIVGLASTATGAGYWLVAADGGIFSFGDAAFYGSAACYSQYFTNNSQYYNVDLGLPVVGMSGTSDGGGYWIVTQNGTVIPFGDARFEGMVSAGGSLPPTPPGGDATCSL